MIEAPVIHRDIGVCNTLVENIESSGLIINSFKFAEVSDLVAVSGVRLAILPLVSKGMNLQGEAKEMKELFHSVTVVAVTNAERNMGTDLSEWGIDYLASSQPTTSDLKIWTNLLTSK